MTTPKQNGTADPREAEARELMDVILGRAVDFAWDDIKGSWAEQGIPPESVDAYTAFFVSNPLVEKALSFGLRAGAKAAVLTLNERARARMAREATGDAAEFLRSVTPTPGTECATHPLHAAVSCPHEHGETMDEALREQLAEDAESDRQDAERDA